MAPDQKLIKTIREQTVRITDMALLIHHQPWHDVHLDFSSPWPLQSEALANF